MNMKILALQLSAGLIATSGLLCQWSHGQEQQRPHRPQTMQRYPPGWEPGPSYVTLPANQQGNFAGIGQGRTGIDFHPDPSFIARITPRMPYVVCPPLPPICTPWPGKPYQYISTGQRNISNHGLQISGAYRGEKWNVSFQIGGGSLNAVDIVDRWCGTRPIYSPAQCSVNPYVRSGGWDCLTYYPTYVYRYGNAYSDTYTYVVPSATGPNTYGYDPRLTQSTVPAATAAPAVVNELHQYKPTLMELADQALQEGRYDVAAEAISRDIVVHGETAHQLRLLSLCYAASAKWVDSISTLRRAHRIDPQLGSDSVSPHRLGLDDNSLRTLTTRAVTYAHAQRNNAASNDAWLLVATLMRAQGRTELAKQMIDRAKSIEPEIAAAFSK